MNKDIEKDKDIDKNTEIVKDLENIKKPYSPEAVKELLLVEKIHQSWFYPNQPKGYIGECRGCYWDRSISTSSLYPCPTLLSAWTVSAPETIIAVKLIRAGELKRDEEADDDGFS